MLISTGLVTKAFRAGTSTLNQRNLARRAPLPCFIISSSFVPSDLNRAGVNQPRQGVVIPPPKNEN
jgi:hypothetical protein